ncbi:MAG: RagB/SusD family nutrient uptake outer membrane protein [Prevotella sp.]|jgi:hypothetical protein|nr:RagB/SusD family nutrient uptake outer membrane protein [Prevotella sp.]
MKLKIDKSNFIVIRKNILRLVLAFTLITSQTACSDFLDIVPDNVASIDHAFENKKEAERYLATLYNCMPEASLIVNPLFLGADDLWTYTENHYTYCWPWKIALGEQTADDVYINAWEGERSIVSMFRGIRECNIFLEEIRDKQRVPELDQYTRKRWIGEANFLKAYFHFYLFRMYGPIPITDKNLPISASPDEVKVKRDPVDKVVEYIVGLLDEASRDLPLSIASSQTEAGRVTKGAALMLKAKVLVTAASPLFNGNSDYADFKNVDGTPMFPATEDRTLWERAVKACEAALDSVPGASLYKFNEVATISDRTKYQMNTRGVVTQRFNSEVIWGRYMTIGNSEQMQERIFVPRIDPGSKKSTHLNSYVSVTFNMVDRFYSKNGVPIEEDINWDYANRFNTTQVGDGQEYNAIKGYTTAKMNLDRENRFYGSLIFDGSLVFMQSCTDRNDNNAYPINAKFGERNGAVGYEYVTVTGYWVRKLTNWAFTMTENSYTTPYYSWPEIRLADLILLYAEALNEVDRRDDAIYQLDLIRERVGLKGVKESWQMHSRMPQKPETREGLRAIIQQEREIELAFEGHRLWDTKRWKKAGDYQNRNVMGWNVHGKTAGEYYNPTLLYEQKFIIPRDYLWPISNNELRRNSNLVQNPGWQ